MKKEREKFAQSKTLCWTCVNAVPTEKNGCSWSMDFEPVKGWKILPPRSRVKGSCTVISCPKYKEG